MLKCVLICLVLTWSVQAQLPSFYKEVDRVVWVVPDLDKALAIWKPSGMVQILGQREASVTAEYRGVQTTSTMRYAAVAFGSAIVNWMQPMTGSNAFADFLKKHPAGGVLGLMHRVSSTDELDAEVKRMHGLGVRTLQQGPLADDGSRYVMFDTAPEGKYVVGLMFMPAVPAGGVDGPGPKVTQFAFVTRELDPVSKYWQKLGWPEMSLTHPDISERTYNEKPATFLATLGWQRHGKIVYEWILPMKGPSAWQDHLTNQGEGFHHLGVSVSDMDAAIAQWKTAGFRNAQAGAWGEKDKKGSGRFAYMTVPGAGVDVELLWNYR